MEAISAFARETFARACASKKLGTAMEERIEIIATTIRSSIRVKLSGFFLCNVKNHLFEKINLALLIDFFVE